MTAYFIDIIIAFIIDLIAGDPAWMPHPVRFIGFLVSRTEKFLRKAVGSGVNVKVQSRMVGTQEKAAGVVLAAFVVVITALLVFTILRAAYLINFYLFHVINVYFIYSALATRCLAVEAGKVYRSLCNKDLEDARLKLSWLVGRETAHLSEKEVIRGTVETVAENIVDGVIAPLFYIVIGGPVFGPALGYACKASNTLDSMVGYMNDKYINFGWASAKLDDLFNYIPARITGLLIPAAAFICGKDPVRSFKIMLRDRRNHKSPNCAYPEAAVAGALGVRLGGTNVYFGREIYKPTIGDAGRELDKEDIRETNRIMYASASVAVVVFLTAAYLVCKLLVL